jgi:LAGLIDADG endonuclease
VNILKPNKSKNDKAVQLIFKITQHKRDQELLNLIAKYFNCGAVQFHGENAFDFQVTKFADNFNLIIPMFKAHPIQGNKQLDFIDFCEVASLINERKHLTVKGLDQIQLIKDRMNTKRKFPQV